MTTSAPPRSLPPPMLPPKVVAQTRIKALQADLAAEDRAQSRAALTYEIAALTELRLQDASGALQLYRSAHGSDSSFRPALFALARLLRERGEYAELANVLEKIAHVARNPGERASALVELGCVLADQLGDAEAGRTRLRQAADALPSSASALLLLERELYSLGAADEIALVVARRAEHAQDPTLRSLLLCESATAQAARGDIDAAIESLVSAAALPARRQAALEQLIRLARKHARHAVAAHAFLDLAALLADGNGPGTSAATAATLAKSSGRDRQLAAFCYREAGRLLLAHTEDTQAAAAAYAQAEACSTGDTLLSLERLEAAEFADDIGGARALALSLLVSADAPRAAALHFHLAELAERQGDRPRARACLQAAIAAQADSPAALAVLEDALLDDGAFSELCDHLEARAASSVEDDRLVALARAAAVAGDRAQDPARALRLHNELLEHGADATMTMRELYGVALRFSQPHLQAQAAEQLLRMDLSDAEHSALVRGWYSALLDAQAPAEAEHVLRDALTNPACEAWAPYGARVASALRRDFAWLAGSHKRLALQAQDVELAAAHGCAEGRALLRAGAETAALAALRRTLELSPGNPYAVALLEETLLARGEAGEAVQLLREAATSEQDAKRGELALLHAGSAAEAAGQLDLAARSYEEAIDRDATALSPLWALKRLGERGNNDARLLSALEGLSLREAATAHAGIANLELGERYDTVGKPELAIAPLVAALEGESVRFEAALSLALLPRNGFDADLRPRALATVADGVAREARADLERERVSELMLNGSGEAWGALTNLTGREASSHADAVLQLLLCPGANERAAALATLARLSDDVAASAELQLHAIRTATLSGLSPAEDALMSGLTLLERAPASLPAAAALDEALSAGDDPEALVQALQARLTHTPAEASDSLCAALARALYAAGHADEAVQLARALLQNDPSDPSAWETLRVAARAIGDFEAVVLACDTLASSSEGEVRALLLEEAATVLQDELQKPTEAEARLRTALEADETRNEVFERLHDLLVGRRDLEGLVELLSARVRVAASEDDRSDLLYEQARVLRALGEREGTLACLDEVLGMEPEHGGALGLAAETHAAQKDWPAAVAALRALAQTDLPNGQKRLVRQGAADFLERNLHDYAGAYRELAALAEAGLADLNNWKRMAQLARRARLYTEAAEALSQAAQLSQAEARASLERERAELLVRELGQPDAARAALRNALAALPVDMEACEQLAGLCETAGERRALLEHFVVTLQSELAAQPAQESLLRALRRTAGLADDRTLEHCALSALVALELATAEEVEAAHALEQQIPGRPNATLSAADLSLLRDTNASAAAWRFAEVICKIWIDATEDRPARHGVDKRARVAKRSDHPVRDAVSSWTASFGAQVSDFYVGGSEPRGLRVVMEAGQAQPWIAGTEVSATLSKPARFQIAEQALAAHQQLLPLTRAERSDARDLLFAALLSFAPSAPNDDAQRLRPRAEQLAARASRAQRRELEQCVSAMRDPERELQTVLDDARQSAQRAGLLACCDLRTALVLGSSQLGERFDLAAVSGNKSALGLLRFWTSGKCQSLRHKLGLQA